MFRKVILIFSVLFTSLATPLSLAASFPQVAWFGNFEFSAGLGIEHLYASHSKIIISEFQTDSLRPNHYDSNNLWKLGIGTSLFDDWFAQNAFFNHLGIELNYYFGKGGKIKGQVWEFESPEFYNYRFIAPVHINRLMLDLKPYLFTYCRFSPYAILGAGLSWNTASYYETVVGENTDPANIVTFRSATKLNWAYDLGLGVRYAFQEHLNVSLEYLYSYLNKMRPKHTTTETVNAPGFKLHSQTVLFNLIVSI